MKRTAKAELRAKTAAELTAQVASLRQDLFKGRISQAVEGKGLGGKKREMRRQIARLLTMAGEKTRAASASAATTK